MRRITPLFLALGCLAQQSEEHFAGPAVLSRPSVAGNRMQPALAFRPFFTVNGVYDTGLAPVSITPDGRIPTVAAAGVEAGVGAYLNRVSRNAEIGLDYNGNYRHYNKQTYFDGSDQFLTLRATRRIAPRVLLSFREAAGTFARSFGLTNPVGTFDPGFTATPGQELFDNRTNFFNTQADLTYALSVRTTFNMGADGFLVRRQSTALYGVTGASARGDVAHRLTRHLTIGADYRYHHFRFTKAFGGSDAHTAGVNLAWRVNQHLEFAVRAGGARVETLTLQRVSVDPEVAAITGVSSGIQAFYDKTIFPAVGARVTRTFRNATAQALVTREVNPGNGVFLTSRLDSLDVYYTYTGVRRWNFGFNANYSRMKALIQSFGSFDGYGAGGGFTRVVGRNFHIVGRYDVRRFQTDFSLVNRTVYRATLGFAFSPGDRPLSLF